jgi:hypothetical protein
MKRAKIAESVQLLPLFDPYLMGYAKRDHLVDREYAARVSREAGWISAVVLVEGRVAATWTHTVANKNLRVTLEPFRRLSPAVRSKVREQVAALAKSLGATGSEVV